MSERKYCARCGAQVRPGNAFCVSCGAPVFLGSEKPGSANPGTSPSEESSPFDSLLTWFRQAAGHLRGNFSGLSTDGIRSLPRRAMEWFRDLPSISKLVLVGLVALVLLVLLSPVAAIVAAVLFGVSIVALIIRVAQKRSLKNWGMVAVGSVALIFTFGFLSDVLYGIGFMGPPGSGSQESSVNSGGSDRSGGETDVATDATYDVVAEEAGVVGGWNYYVVSSSTDLESLNLVAQDIQQQRLQTGKGLVYFYNSQAGAESADFDGLLGVATIYQDELQVRAFYSETSPSLSSGEVEQVVDVIADNGYVVTTVNGKHLPIMPDFMYEEPNPASATATASASATASAGAP